MESSVETLETLETVSRVLWRCAVIGYIILVIWFVAIIIPGSPIYTLHGQMFDLTAHECALLHFGLMGAFKIAVMTFFLIPWVAIRLVLRCQRCQRSQPK
jgi:hypothetical protein